MRRVATTALYGVFVQLLPEGGELGECRGSHSADPCRAYAVKRDGEWRIIYEIFRDMRLPVLPICLLMGASFCFYLRLLILGGMMPGHAYHAHRLFILDAPIFNGLDVFLPFGIIMPTLPMILWLYYAAYRPARSASMLESGAPAE